jgi:hypothetical protein
MIRQFGAEIGRYMRATRQKLLGIIATAEQARNWDTIREVDAALRDVVPALQRLMLRGLHRLAEWSWDSAVENWLAAVPVDLWLRRGLLPEGRVTEGWVTILGEDRRPLHRRNEYERIIHGQATRAEALRLIRQFEFPPPSPARVRRILDATSAQDGRSAMERVKLVAGDDLVRLQRTIVGGLSRMPDEDQASALRGLSVQIRPFFADGEGVNYKAQRIARTESIRVAEAMQREANERVADVYTGIRFLRRGGRPCEECDLWDDKVFWRDDAGQFVSDSGELLPDIPVHPNCLCYTQPELRPDLEAKLPPVNLGAAYAAGAARAEKELADLLNS